MELLVLVLVMSHKPLKVEDEIAVIGWAMHTWWVVEIIGWGHMRCLVQTCWVVEIIGWVMLHTHCLVHTRCLVVADFSSFITFFYLLKLIDL